MAQPDSDADLADDVVRSSADLRPATLETSARPGDSGRESLDAPVLIMPPWEDPERYHPEGAFIDLELAYQRAEVVIQ